MTIRVGGGAGSGTSGTALTVQDEGTPLATAADTLNFVGSAVTATGTGTTKTITVTSGAVTGVPTSYINVKDAAYGAVGDGTTDDTTAIQNAINACPAGGNVFFPNGTYKITSTLTVNKGCTLQGASMTTYYGPSVSGKIAPQNLPYTSPFLRGAVLNMRTAATDAVKITAVGDAVHVRDLGVVFGVSGDSVIMANTGHGFTAVPPAITGGIDQGMMGATWDNVAVFGHDGNHYAFQLVNIELCVFTGLQAWGGGGFDIDSRGPNLYFGNSMFNHPYLVTCAPGTAHMVRIGQTATTQLLRFYGLQCWLYAPDVSVAGKTLTPLNTQLVWTEPNSSMNVIHDPDFESNVSGATMNMGSKSMICGNPYIALSNTGQSNNLVNLPGGESAISNLSGSGYTWRYIRDGLSSWGTGSGTSSSATTALGTSPPAPVINGTSLRGTVTFGTGTSPTTGNALFVNVPGDPFNVLKVVVSPNNAATSALGLYVASATHFGFTLGVSNAPAASQANTTYSFTYMCIG